MSVEKYLGKRKFGRLGNAKVDSDDDSDDDPDLIDKTPVTKRKIIEEKTKKKVKKLGQFETFFTLMKGFVCTNCLYLAKSFVNGGWLF